MRRALYSLVLCALLISSGAFAKVGLLQFASSNGVPTLYFANGGSDSNPCSSILPCQTISHLNGLTLAAGTTVLFDGGETFSGQLAFTTSNAPNGMPTIGSYGSGLAIIQGSGSGCLTIGAGVTNISTPNALCLIGPTAFSVATNFASATSVTTSPGSNIPAGSAIVILGFDGGPTPSDGVVTDTQGNTYTPIRITSRNNSAANGSDTSFYCYNCKALSTSDTITYTNLTSGTDGLFISVAYITGLAPGVNPLDPAVTATAAGNSSAPAITCNAPSQAGEVLIGYTAGGGSLSPANPYTNGVGWGSPYEIFQGILAIGAGFQMATGVADYYGTVQETLNPAYNGTGPWDAQCFGLKMSKQPLEAYNVANEMQTSGTSAVVPLPTAIPAGSLIIVDSYSNSANPLLGTVTDTQGNTYTEVTAVSGDIWYYSYNSKALSTTDTITHMDTLASFLAPTISYSSYVSGASNPLDSGVTATNAGSNSAQTVTSGVPAQTNELIYASTSGLITTPPPNWSQFSLWSNIVTINNPSLAAQTATYGTVTGSWAAAVMGFEK